MRIAAEEDKQEKSEQKTISARNSSNWKKVREIFKQHYGITIRVCFTTFKVKKLFFSKVQNSNTLAGQCRLQVSMFE